MKVLMLVDSSSHVSPSVWVNGTQLVPWLAKNYCELSISEAFPRPVARTLAAIPVVRRVAWKMVLPHIRQWQVGRLVHDADVVIVHKSITHIQDEPVLERRLRQLHDRIIFNFDDATHDRGIPYLDERLSLADAAWVGNPILLDFAKEHNPRVELIESAVDCDHYTAKRDYTIRSPVKLCWSGTPSSYRYLEILREPLRRLSRVLPCVITVMSRTRFSFCDPDIQDRWLPFSHAGEVCLFQSSDIGLMPLPDEPYERAKENYKTKLYLASGLPVVASPVGMNNVFISQGERGLLARSSQDWVDCVVSLAGDPSLRKRCGTQGREFAYERYRIEVVGRKLLQLFNTVSRSEWIGTNGPNAANLEAGV